MLVNFNEYNEIKELRAKNISDTADLLIEENMEAFEELAK